MRLADRFLAFMDRLMGIETMEESRYLGSDEDARLLRDAPDGETMRWVSESDLRSLIDLAEDGLITRANEYDDYPTPEDREVLERAWGLLGRPLPDYFRRKFGWGKEGAVA